MQIAKLTISYERGLHRNDERDLSAEGKTLGLLGRGDKTADGKVIRGVGTHYENEAVAALVKERDADARRIYSEFRGRFLATPLEGVYVISKRGEAKDFVSNIEHRDDIRVYVTEFELTAPAELNADELRAWGVKIQRQLASVSLGRTAEADEDGLRALESLAGCPVLKKSTGDRIKELVADLRASKLTRIELKRGLEKLNVEIEQAPLAQLAPRRTPMEVR